MLYLKNTKTGASETRKRAAYCCQSIHKKKVASPPNLTPEKAFKRTHAGSCPQTTLLFPSLEVA